MGKEIAGLGLFLSALVNVYGTVALGLEGFNFGFLDTVDLYIH